MDSDWEATWDARLAALPDDEEKYGWYAKLGEIVELNESAGDEAADPDLYENVKKGLTGGEGHAAIVRDYGPRSRQIAAAIKNLTETSGRAAVQKAEMKSLKLDDLLVAAEAALPASQREGLEKLRAQFPDIPIEYGDTSKFDAAHGL